MLGANGRGRAAGGSLSVEHERQLGGGSPLRCSSDHSGTFRAGQGLLTSRVAGYSTQPHLDLPTTGHHRRVATTAVIVVLHVTAMLSNVPQLVLVLHVTGGR